jgi:adenosylcobyric acid synthase
MPVAATLGPVKGALLVAGTSSDAGKSVLTAGLCRWLARQGVRVAPFKAQNMALNSAVTADGAEIGRAQAMQAAAAGVEPEAAMNPVLLKPGSETRSQVVLLGRPVAETGALDYQELKPRLESAVAASLADLRRRFDVVICEGAGSPAEINLRHRDIANMGLARAADLPVIVVGDIDRGGLLAALYGTLAVLDPADQRHIAAFVVNKFRGDVRLLAPGLDMLASMTGRPTLGVLPWHKDLWLDAEDSLDLDTRPRAALPPHGAASLRVAVVRLPRMSNVTDVDPLAAEPGVIVDLATTPAQLDGPRPSRSPPPRPSPGRRGPRSASPSRAMRSTTEPSPRTAAIPSSTAARRAPSAAPPGTASSRTTASGGRSCVTWPPGRAATSPPRPT